MSEPYDPDKHGTYGEWLRSKNIHTRTQGWTHATRDQVREYVGRDGRRVKDTTDQLGNRVVQHGMDSQSVIASPQTVAAKIPIKEGSREPRTG
ncbi:hypothetical protein ACQEUU_37310 [Nonomuraea sp. CA-218870]|uniref:hypothetical protein n=1 Tax=Nonomuraea sp. CA-218870 TaxID=3239998 RepID=UPI003D8E91B3